MGRLHGSVSYGWNILRAVEVGEPCILFVGGLLYVPPGDVPTAKVYLLLAWVYCCIRIDSAETQYLVHSCACLNADRRLFVAAAGPWGSKRTVSTAA